MVPEQKDVTVEIIPCGLSLLVVTVTKHAAREWLTRVAPQFGKWVVVESKKYLLVVDAGFDLAEVAAYLREG